MHLKERLSGVSIGVYLVIMGYAVSSWVDASAIILEFPVFVNALPEGWQLPSNVLMMMHISKISAIIFMILRKCLPGKIQDWAVIYCIMVVDAVGCMFLAFLWDYTSLFKGKEHSTALMALSLLLTLADNVSMLTFIPYMAKFKEQYLSAYYLGEGLCLLLPSILAFFQGASNLIFCSEVFQTNYNDTTGTNLTEYTVTAMFNEPKFNPMIYFICVFGIICMSIACFSFLHFSSYCKKAYLTVDKDNDTLQNVKETGLNTEEKVQAVLLEETSAPNIELMQSQGCTGQAKDDLPIVVNSTDEIGKLLQKENADISDIKSRKREEENMNLELDYKNRAEAKENVDAERKGINTPVSYQLSTVQYIYVLAIVCLSSGIQFGVMLSILPYSALPHGNMAFSISLNMGAVLHALVGFLGLFWISKSLIILGIAVFLTTAMWIFHIILAHLSPFPPLKGETSGILMVVLTYCVLIICAVYIRVAASAILQATRGHSGLLWFGIMCHIGQGIGGILVYIIIVVVNLLEAEPPCG